MRNCLPDSRLLLALLACLALACTGNHQPAGRDTVTATTDITQKGYAAGYIGIDTDTSIVSRQAAVFYEPDSLRIARRKGAIGEENFYIGVEDYAYYLNAAHDFLDSARLPVVDAKNKQFLKFVGTNHTTQIIKPDTLPELWGIYFFDPAKKAKQVEITRIEEEYNSYFK